MVSSQTKWLSNASADGLAATKEKYVYYGSHSGIDSALLPGVQVSVLGPPTPNQHPPIAHQVEHRDDYWVRLTRNFERNLASSFSRPRTLPDSFSAIGPEGWMVRRLQNSIPDQALQLVRWLDDEMNNTSVILLLRIRDTRLLFAGDAQGENWDYSMARDRTELEKIDLYKVGHHGSRNATPELLVKAWQRKRRRNMTAVMSTLSGFYGDSLDHTEVPRTRLVAALRSLMKDRFF